MMFRSIVDNKPALGCMQEHGARTRTELEAGRITKSAFEDVWPEILNFSEEDYYNMQALINGSLLRWMLTIPHCARCCLEWSPAWQR